MPGLNVEIGVELDDPFNQILKFPDIALQGELEQQLFGIGRKLRGNRPLYPVADYAGGMFKRRVLRR